MAYTYQIPGVAGFERGLYPWRVGAAFVPDMDFPLLRLFLSFHHIVFATQTSYLPDYESYRISSHNEHRKTDHALVTKESKKAVFHDFAVLRNGERLNETKHYSEQSAFWIVTV